MTTAFSEEEVLARMLSDDFPDPRPGRPPIVLEPEVAAWVLRELEVDQRSYRTVARRWRRSRQWLRNAHVDGRLQEMTRAGEFTGP